MIITELNGRENCQNNTSTSLRVRVNRSVHVGDICSIQNTEKQPVHEGIMKKNVFRFITVGSAGRFVLQSEGSEILLSLYTLFFIVIILLLPYFILDIKMREKKS